VEQRLDAIPPALDGKRQMDKPEGFTPLRIHTASVTSRLSRA